MTMFDATFARVYTEMINGLTVASKNLTSMMSDQNRAYLVVAQHLGILADIQAWSFDTEALTLVLSISSSTGIAELPPGIGLDGQITRMMGTNSGFLVEAKSGRYTKPNLQARWPVRMHTRQRHLVIV